MSGMLDFGKYLFIQEYKDSKITHEFDGQTDLYDVIEQFEHFLRGAGFHFEGHLDIVNEEEIEYNSSFNSPDFEPTVTFSGTGLTPNWSHPLSKDGLTKEDVAIREGKYPGEDSGVEDMK